MPILRIAKAMFTHLLYYWYFLVLRQRSSGGQKEISVTKKHLLHIICHPCPGSGLRHKMMGPKPVPLLALLSQCNHEIQLIDTKVSPVLTQEVRWAQVHAGYTPPLPWNSAMVTGLPCPTRCSSISFSSQLHPAGIKWEKNQARRKRRLLDLLGLLSLPFCLRKSQAAPGQLSPSLLLPSASPKEMLIPVGCKRRSLNWKRDFI